MKSVMKPNLKTWLVSSIVIIVFECTGIGYSSESNFVARGNNRYSRFNVPSGTDYVAVGTDTNNSELYTMSREKLVRSSSNNLSKIGWVEGEFLFKLVETQGVFNNTIKHTTILTNVKQRFSLSGISPLFSLRAQGLVGQIYRARIPSGKDIFKTMADMAADPAIAWVEPNYHRYIQSTTPNDPLYSLQNHLEMINAPIAWDVTIGNQDVIIAIIDTGVDWNHPDLAANIWINQGERGEGKESNGIDDDGNGFIDDWHGWDFVTIDANGVYSGEDPGPPDNNPMDFEGHGTSVSGIIGSVGNNGIGVTGVNWCVRLMPLRAGYKNNKGQGLFNVADIAAALIYARDNGAHIVNMSFGGPDFTHTEKTAIDYCADAGILLIGAAGNEASDQPIYPSGFDNVVAVASLDSYKRRSHFSNYGIWVDLAAPGEDVYTTEIGGTYRYVSGTSTACPIVSGVAGLIKAVHPTWTANNIALQLKATASNINNQNSNFVNMLGAGLVAADQAIGLQTFPVKLGIIGVWAEENDGSSDGMFDPGETLCLRVSVRNFALGQRGISISLSTSDPYVSVINGTCILGDLDTERTTLNWNEPLCIFIDRNVPRDHIAVLNFQIATTSSGLVATDTIPLRLNPLLRYQVKLAQHTSTNGYVYPQLLMKPGSFVNILYGSEGYWPNHVFARTTDSSGNWGAALPISQGPGIMSAFVHCGAVGKDGRIHACFEGALGDWYAEVFYTSRDPLNGDWNMPLQLTTGAKIYDPNIPGFNPPCAIAVDAQDDPHIVWEDYRKGVPELYYIYYDGKKWSSEAPIVVLPDPLVAIDLKFDSTGNGYLLWDEPQQNMRVIRMIILTKGVWSTPVDVTLTYYDYSHSIVVNSKNNLHLVYNVSNGVAHRKYDGTTWSAPSLITSDGAYPLIAISPNDTVHVVFERLTGWAEGDYYTEQLYESAYNSGSWSDPIPITNDRTGTVPIHINFVADNNGITWLAGVTWLAGDKWGRGMESNIYGFTSDKVPSRLPSRPIVTAYVDLSSDPASLHASWSSSHSSGIAEYQYAIGTVPGEGDFRYWSSVGTNIDETIDLTDTPLLIGQKYYVSVCARNNAEYWSPVGISNPIQILRWVYVDPSATGAGDGKGWINAYNYLQDALYAARPGDQIRVAAGIYKPDQDCNHPEGTGSRSATFRLKNSITITGSFAGLAGTDPNARDLNLYKTILSGDIGNPNDDSDNSCFVISGNADVSTAKLDGLIITGGNANVQSGLLNGGGMHNYRGNPILVNCTFIRNSASSRGGGLYNDKGNPELINCIFIGNSSSNGGAIYTYGSKMAITNCIFMGNYATYRGGAMHIQNSSPTITNCTFTQNSTSDLAGAIYNRDYCKANLVNCIFWLNTPSEVVDLYSSTSTITYSDVKGGWPGKGNIDSNPLFVRSPNPGVDGLWGTADDDDGDLRLRAGSLCIDAGNNAAVPTNTIPDLTGNPRYVDGNGDGPAIVDMGAYERQCVLSPTGDINGDCSVNFPDWAVFADNWLMTCSVPNWCEGADIDRDTKVGFTDLKGFAENWLYELRPKEMLFIPGGEFKMGDHFNEGNVNERPMHRVQVQSFLIGKYEITNLQYCQYLNSAFGSSVYVSGGVVCGINNNTYCDTSTSSSDSQISYSGGVFLVRTKSGRNMANDPMVCVNWYGAAAYCNWRSQQEGKEPCYNLATWECDFSKNGYRLPTEAEWEYAARGGLIGKRFPWGDTISNTQANYQSSIYDFDVSPTYGNHPLWNVGIYPCTSPVGFFDGSLKYKADYNWPGSVTSYQTTSGANNYGLYDMAGNVWEWCNDWCSDTYYSVSPYYDPPGPANGSERVYRGGDWNNSANLCRVAVRGSLSPYDRFSFIGFRVVLKGTTP